VKIQVVGVGVVGSAQAYLAKTLGHEVFGYDRRGSTADFYRSVRSPEVNVDVTFVCTPEAAVSEVVGDLFGKGVKGLYVIKSTVPPGTTQSLMERHGGHICHNPEFLREKILFEDVLHPSSVVIGECCAEHSRVLKDFYTPLGCPVVVTRPTVSELVKLSLNSYLATLISFWNQVDKAAIALGLSTREVADIVKLNPRVSGYGTEFFGSPFGGKCLPKDLDQLIGVMHEVGADASLLEAVRDFNKALPR